MSVSQKRVAMLGGVLSLLTLAAGERPALAQVNEHAYGSMPGWNISAIFTGRNFGYCAATTATRGFAFRIAHDGRDWGIGLQSGSGPVRGRINLDGKIEAVNFEPLLNDGWVFVRLERHGLDRVRYGKSIGIAIGANRPARISLDDANAAMTTLQECARRRGMAVAQRPQPRPFAQGPGSGPPPGSRPAPTPAPEPAAAVNAPCPRPASAPARRYPRFSAARA